MATLAQKIIKNLQCRIAVQSEFERSQIKYQTDMHRSYFEMADLNSQLINENAQLRRDNKKNNNK